MEATSITDDLKIDYRVGAILQDNKYEQIYNNANGLNVTNVFSLNFATIQTYYRRHASQYRLRRNLFMDRSTWPLKNQFSLTRVCGQSGLPLPLLINLAILLLAFCYYFRSGYLPEAISFLKLSGNYAEVGNGGIAQLRFNTYSYSHGAGHGFIFRDATKAIPDLKPEIVKNLEFGIDAKFLENRLGFQFTVYKSNSTNQLLKVSVPVGTGFSSQYINAGDIQNKGLELVLNATPVKSDI